MQGTIPATLARLTKMIVLDINGNYLQGAIPPLPFSQYGKGPRMDDCCLQCIQADHGGSCHGAPAGHFYQESNKFDCPLPPGADTCNCNATSILCS